MMPSLQRKEVYPATRVEDFSSTDSMISCHIHWFEDCCRSLLWWDPQGFASLPLYMYTSYDPGLKIIAVEVYYKKSTIK